MNDDTPDPGRDLARFAAALRWDRQGPSRAELEAKAPQLAAYRGGAREAEMRGVIERVGSLANAPGVPNFLERAR